jgi:hypothetical protein
MDSRISQVNEILRWISPKLWHINLEVTGWLVECEREICKKEAVEDSISLS